MKIATTTGDFSRFCETDEERIYELYKAGFRYVDFSMYNMADDSVYMQDGWRDEVLKIKRYAEELGMTFVQAHSPGGNPLSSDTANVSSLVKRTLRSIEICEILGIKNTVSHTGTAKGLSKAECFEKNKEFYDKLLPTAKRCGVNVLCENQCEANSCGMYYANSGADMRELVKYVNHPNFHACWDTGHGNCDGNQYNEIVALGDELYAIHYNDNRGKCDEHIAPFLGTLNHDEVINALIDIGFKGYFTLEAGASLRQEKYWLGDRRSFDKDTRLANPPLFLQQHFEKLLYSIAEYILSSYNLLEK